MLHSVAHGGNLIEKVKLLDSAGHRKEISLFSCSLLLFSVYLDEFVLLVTNKENGCLVRK